MFLADKEMGKLMGDNFVIVHLDVQEHPEKKNLENAGGEDYLKKWKGEGLPFIAILDPNNDRVVADTNLTGEAGSNIGYPSQPNEIQHFMKMLKAGSNMTDAQRGQIESWLTAHAPK